MNVSRRTLLNVALALPVVRAMIPTRFIAWGNDIPGPWQRTVALTIQQQVALAGFAVAQRDQIGAFLFPIPIAIEKGARISTRTMWRDQDCHIVEVGLGRRGQERVIATVNSSYPLSPILEAEP